MWKKAIYGLLGLFLILLLLGFVGVRYFNNMWFAEKPNYISYSTDDHSVHFLWGKQKVEGVIEPHSAMLIPFRIKGLDHTFTFQFDTGSHITMIHGHALASLRRLGVLLDEVITGDKSFVEQMSIEFGGEEVDLSMISIFEGYGAVFEEADTASAINIGTIGSDFIEDRIVSIDYKNQMIRPLWMDTLPDFQKFSFDGRRFMLPATIRGKELELYYDSGSSAFGLITSKHRYDHFTDEDVDEISHDGNRRGETLTLHHKPTDAKIEIGRAVLDLERVSYVDMYARFQRFMTPFTKIGGWLGNKPFLNHTLIIDTKEEEFIVI